MRGESIFGFDNEKKRKPDLKDFKLLRVIQINEKYGFSL